MSNLKGGHLKRDITSFGAMLLVLNGVIGVGIFALPANVAIRVGDFAPWLFPIFGLLMLTVVLTFAELASYFKKTGGPVVYAERAFGPMIGFQTGWLLYLGRLTAFAANLNAMIIYASFIFPEVDAGIWRITLIFMLVLTLVTVNIKGVKEAIKMVTIMTILKLGPVFLLIALATPYISSDVLIPHNFTSLTDIEGAALLLLYAFVGFEGVLMTAGETSNPRKTIPRALVGTVILIAVLYFLIQVTYMATITEYNSDGAPLIEVGQVLAGPIGAVVITLAIVFSIIGNLSSIVVAAPRITFALAQAGSLPKWFGRIHDKHSTPSNSILFLGVAAFILAVSGSFVYLAIVSALARMVAFAICIAGLPIIRNKADEETKAQAWRLKGWYIIPIIGFSLCAWAALQSSQSSFLMLVGMVALGTGLYLFAYHQNKGVGINNED
jgi:basic amino acid/polyamine antiporter, APA family